MILEIALIGVGFTGALTLIYLKDHIGRRLRMIPTATAHFSPKGGCTEVIVRELRRARREVLVQAYSFTSPAIAEALIDARRRGVDVQILLDRSNEKETYSELGELERHGLKLLIDAHHAIAHNKVMVIDRRLVLTGSFNFTNQAEHDNAENLLVLHGDPDLIQAYRHNFFVHLEHGQSPGAAVRPSAAADARPAAAQVPGETKALPAHPHENRPTAGHAHGHNHVHGEPKPAAEPEFRPAA